MEGCQREEEELSGLGEELDGGSDRQVGVEMALRTPTGVGVPPLREPNWRGSLR